MNGMVNQQRPFEGLRELALFAGAGGGILGGHLLGWRTVCAVEWEPYPASVLAARQDEGVLPPFPIWDDVQTFDGRPWAGCCDVVSGGFPCQDISVAGKGAGIGGERSGMWAHMARIVGEVRPKFVFVENSPMLTSRGLDRVLGDLAALGYDAEWMCLSAAECGARHKRDRVWVVATPSQPEHSAELGDDGWVCNSCGVGVFDGCECNHGEWQCQDCGEWTYPFYNGIEDGCQHCGSGNVLLAHTVGERGCGGNPGGEHAADAGEPPRYSWNNTGAVEAWDVEPDVGRVVDGVAARVDRLKAIGNGQVPRVAAAAFLELAGRLGLG